MCTGTPAHYERTVRDGAGRPWGPAAAAAAKSGGKAKKLVKSRPPEKGFVQWNQDNFRQKESGLPETLESSFAVSHQMVLAVLSRYGDGKRGLRDLLVNTHEVRRCNCKPVQTCVETTWLQRLRYESTASMIQVLLWNK